MSMTMSFAPLLNHLRLLTATPTPESDAALLGRFVSGDEAAFNELLGRHGPMVWRVCRRVLGDAHTVEDAFQAAFLVLARRAGSIRQPSRLTGWLYGVALRVARKARGAGARRQFGRAADGTEPSARGREPVAELTARELLHALDEEVERLPEVYRLPLILCALEGLPQDEVARRLGWTPGSVKGRLERGRRRLHARLVRRGLTLAVALAAAEASRGLAAVPAVLALATGRRAASAGAVKLADGVATGAAATKLRTLLLLGLAVGLIAGVGVLGARMSWEGPAQAPPAPAAGVPPLRLRCPAGPAVTMQAHAEPFGDLAFSPDGRRLAGAAFDGAVWIWDARTGKRLLALPSHAGIATAVAFDPDGTLLASAARSEDGPGKMRLSDAQSGQTVRTCEGGGPGPLAFSPDGKLLAGTGGHQPAVLTLWDVATGKVVRTLGEKTEGSPVAFSPDGSRLAGIDDLRVTVWEVATGKVVLRPGGDLPGCVAFSPDGKWLAAGGAWGEVWVWDAASGNKVWQGDPRPKVLLGSPRRVVHLAFTPDGKSLVTAGHRPHRPGLFEPWAPEFDGEVKVWDAGTGKEQFAFQTQVAGVSGACLSPDGTRVAASTLAGGQPVQIWSLTGE
jgi:RNA polymerase sigma factor (sigma-70 family)